MNYLNSAGIGMTAFLLICLYWAFQLFTAVDPWIPLDFANFIIHEIGHLLFIFTGEFMMVLSGSLFQLLVPTGLGLYWWIKKQAYYVYSTGFCIFWLGDNFINVARYVGDARKMVLPIYGSRHDWFWLLRQMELLQHDTTIAGVFFFLGRLLLIVGIGVMVWGVVKEGRKTSVVDSQNHSSGL